MYFVLALLAACSGGLQPAGGLKAAATQSEANTIIETPDFVVTLPGQWQQEPSQDSVAYHRGDDRVFVTTYVPSEDLSQTELVARAERIAKMRRDLINDLARGDATSSIVAMTANRAEFSFDGEDRRNAKRFAVSVVPLTRRIVTIAVYRPLPVSDRGFLALAHEIVSTLRER